MLLLPLDIKKKYLFQTIKRGLGTTTNKKIKKKKREKVKKRKEKKKRGKNGEKREKRQKRL